MPRLSLVRSGEDAPRSAPPERPAVLVVDDRRRCVEANREACVLFGKPREAIIGGRIDRLITPAMRPRLDYFWKAFRDGGGHGGPFDLADPAEVPAVVLSLTENLIPGRHLVVLSSADAPARPAAPAEQPGEGPEQRPASATPGKTPSAREREILGLLATGATDPEIAKTLELSPATVQTHVRNAKSKLGARTRAQAVAIALGEGLIAAVARSSS